MYFSVLSHGLEQPSDSDSDSKGNGNRNSDCDSDSEHVAIRSAVQNRATSLHVIYHGMLQE